MTDRSDPDEADAGGSDDDVKPDWWRAAIEQHREYDLLPYEPSRLADGTPKYRVVSALEAELGVHVQFVGVDVNYGDEWQIRVDGEMIETVEHERVTDGYSIFHIESDELVESVRSHVEEG